MNSLPIMVSQYSRGIKFNIESSLQNSGWLIVQLYSSLTSESDLNVSVFKQYICATKYGSLLTGCQVLLWNKPIKSS